MSHYTVAVVTAEEPTQDILAKALQPFHEFECTGTDDEYVVTIDVTDVIRESYRNATRERICDPATGRCYDVHDERFYREATPKEFELIKKSDRSTGLSWMHHAWKDGLGYRPKVHYVPDGWVRERYNVPDVLDFEDYVTEDGEVILGLEEPDLSDTHKYGYAQRQADGQVRCFQRTNPNKRWDWWVVGGRWSGMLDGQDSCRVGDLDLQKMQAKAQHERQLRLDKKLDEIDKTLEEIMGLWTIFATRFDAMTKVWQEGSWGGARRWDWFRSDDCPDAAFREAVRSDVPSSICSYLDGIRIDENDADLLGWPSRAVGLTTYAVLDAEGNWSARGEMGWFGMSSDTESAADWTLASDKFFRELPDSHYITIIDCHI